MKKTYTVLVFVIISLSGMAQDFKLKVWTNGAPDSNGMNLHEEIGENKLVRNVSEAEMYVYLPKKEINTGAAIVICPGGGYVIEAMGHEGSDMAEWLSQQGVAGIVLKYRLPYGHDHIPLEDTQRALRIVRQMAVEWGINSSKVGIAGSSAGGHLASTAGTRFDLGDPDALDPIDRCSCRPDFMLLLYPVITFGEEIGHMGSRTNLIGSGNNWELVERYSNELHVTSQTPPTFLILADDDGAVPPRNSIDFYLALKKYNIPAEMHIFRRGGHGFGMNKNNLPIDQWPNLFAKWMKEQGITGCQEENCQVNKSQDVFTWDNATIYFLFTDRFCNGDHKNDNNYNRKTDYGNDTINAATFHGGDVAGITKKLKEGYFTKLGVNVIWLTGVYEQIHGWVGGGNKNDFPHYAYHGYYPMDLTSMDKNYGTIEEFREFVNLAHSQGIRVIMDAGLNHPGYPTLLDAVQFGFGGMKMTTETAREHIVGWGYNKIFKPVDSPEWDTWWGKDWIRSQDEDAGGLLTESIAGIPDFRTESTKPVTIPVFLQKKWNDEESLNVPWTVPSTREFRKNMNMAPTDYIIKWLAAWVREFGIDGFRCDVVENVDSFRWKQLNEECNIALSEWRKNNMASPASKWTDRFWMTGDIWDSGFQYRPKYAAIGFNSIVNFTFPKTGDLKKIGSVWQQYADSLNARNNWNTISFLNNTYKRDVDINNMIDCGTTFLLSPGAIQIFYGDEVARKQSVGRFLSDPIQGYRSDYPWNCQNLKVLKHWQVLGNFRKRHLSVGAGKQICLTDNVFARVYERNGLQDRVIIAISEKNFDVIPIKNIFPEGTRLRNAYTNETALVKGNQIKFKAVNHIILIEEFSEIHE